MKKIIKMTSLVAIVSLMAACSTWDSMDKAEKGMVIGAGTGAVAAAAATDTIFGTAVGGALGTWAGAEIGKALDDK